MAQTGDVKFGKSDGSSFDPRPRRHGGGSDKPNLKSEFLQHEPCPRGTCSMARSQDPHSATPPPLSQFFICFDDAGFLNRQYTVWGPGHVRQWTMSTRSSGGEPVIPIPRQDRLDEGRGRRQGLKHVLRAGFGGVAPLNSARFLFFFGARPVRVDLFDFDLPEERDRAPGRQSRATAPGCSASMPLGRLRRLTVHATLPDCRSPGDALVFTTPGDPAQLEGFRSRDGNPIPQFPPTLPHAAQAPTAEGLVRPAAREGRRPLSFGGTAHLLAGVLAHAQGAREGGESS